MSTDARVRASPPSCRTCGQTDAAKCQRAHYCSTACQKADWPRHKQDGAEQPIRRRRPQWLTIIKPKRFMIAASIKRQRDNFPLPNYHSSWHWCCLRRSSVPITVTVALCCNQLALVLFTQAAFAQAAALYQRALVIFETNHGPDHPEVATVLCNWGEMLSNPKVMLRKRGP